MPKTAKTPCIQYALHYIATYPKTDHELRVKLLEKGYAEADIQETMHYLTHNNYVDDVQYTQSYLGGEVIRKGKPLITVIAKLRVKGVDQDVIDGCIDEVRSDCQEGMKTKVKKEIDRMQRAGVDNIKILQKLQRRGYPFGLLKEAVEERNAERSI